MVVTQEKAQRKIVRHSVRRGLIRSRWAIIEDDDPQADPQS